MSSWLGSISTYVFGASPLKPITPIGDGGRPPTTSLEGATKSPPPSVRHDPAQGKDVSRSYGDQQLHALSQKLEELTPKDPVKEGFIDAFKGRAEVPGRLMKEGLPGTQAISKGISHVKELTEFVGNDGQKDLTAGEAVRVGKAEVRQRIEEMDLVKSAKVTVKAGMVATTYTDKGMEELRETSDKWVAAEKAKLGTTVATGVLVGLGLTLLTRKVPPGAAKTAVQFTKAAWTTTGGLNVGYKLQDIHDKVHKGSAGVKEGMRVVEERNAARREAMFRTPTPQPTAFNIPRDHK
jgi:hypothetical protein